MGVCTIRKRYNKPSEHNSKFNLEKVSGTKVSTKKRYAPSSKKGKQAKARTRNCSQSSQDQEPAAQIRDSSDPNDNSSDPNEDFKVDVPGLPTRRITSDITWPNQLPHALNHSPANVCAEPGTYLLNHPPAPEHNLLPTAYDIPHQSEDPHEAMAGNERCLDPDELNSI